MIPRRLWESKNERIRNCIIDAVNAKGFPHSEETLICSGRDDPASVKRDGHLNPLLKHILSAKGSPRCEEIFICAGRDDWI
jgi:hypothetical protein